METIKQTMIDDLFNSEISLIDVQSFSTEKYLEMIKNTDRVILVLNNASKDEKEIQQLARIIVLKAELYNRIKNYSEAFKNFEITIEIIKRSKEDFFLAKLKSLYGLAWTTARMGDYQNGIRLSNILINYAIKEKKLFGSYFIVRGACQKELGNFEKAERDFTIGNNPTYVTMIEQKGDKNIF